MSSPVGRERGLGEKTLAGALWMSSASIAQVPLQLGVLALLARHVAPAEFGVVGACLIVVGLAQTIAQLGTREALVQLPVLEPRHVAAGNCLSLTLGLAGAGAVWLLAPVLSSLFGVGSLSPFLRWLALVVLVSSASVASEGMLLRQLRYRTLAVVDLVAYGVGYGLVGAIGAIAGWGAWALVGATVGRETLRAALLVSRARPPLRLALDPGAARDLLRYGAGLTLSLVPTFVALQADNFIVGRWQGASALGIYGRAYNMMSMPVMLLGTAMDRVLFPAMAALQQEAERIAGAVLRALRLMALASLPISGVLVVLAPELVAILLGPDWAGVTTPVRILAAGVFFRMTYKVSDSLVKAKGAVYRRAWRQAIWAALIVGGSLFGGRWGVGGVAGGVTIAMGVIMLMTAHLGNRLVGLSWRQYWSSQLRPAVAAAAFTAVVAVSAWGGREITGSPVAVVALALLPAVVAGSTVWRLCPRAFLGADTEWAASIIGGIARRRRTRPGTGVEGPT